MPHHRQHKSFRLATLPTTLGTTAARLLWLFHVQKLTFPDISQVRRHFESSVWSLIVSISCIQKHFYHFWIHYFLICIISCTPVNFIPINGMLDLISLDFLSPLILPQQPQSTCRTQQSAFIVVACQIISYECTLHSLNIIGTHLPYTAVLKSFPPDNIFPDI